MSKERELVITARIKLMSSVIFIVYIFSVLQTTQMAVVIDTPKLSQIVQQIQDLDNEAFNSSSDFVSTFQNSVNSLRFYAGLGSVILHKQSQSKPEQTVLTTYTYRLPHLISNAPHLPPPISVLTKIQPFSIKQYTSHTISPETPPPNIFQHTLTVTNQYKTTINA